MSHDLLSLTLLGSPSLALGGVPLTISPGSSLVCAYLALAPRDGRARAVAAADLFADCAPTTARRRLNTALWRLRTEVRSHTDVEIVTAGDHRVALNGSVDLVVDTAVIEHLAAPALDKRAEDVTPADAASLERAVSLTRGRLVESCDDEWVLGARHRFETRYLRILDHLLRFHGARGDITAVARYGELALDLEPLREDIHRHLIRAYAAAGRTDLAEQQFERCRLVLLEELGADPMPETLAAYARAGRGQPRPPADVASLVSELERARRDVDRLATSVERALEQLRQLV